MSVEGDLQDDDDEGEPLAPRGQGSPPAVTQVHEDSAGEVDRVSVLPALDTASCSHCAPSPLELETKVSEPKVPKDFTITEKALNRDGRL